MGRLLAVLLLLTLLSSCGTEAAPRGTPDRSGATRDDDTSLSPKEIDEAVAAARKVIADQDASISHASAIGRSGRVDDSNTGHPCSSGRVLAIRLIGDFSSIATTGHPGEPGQPPPDVTVQAIDIDVDAESGLACLIGVRTNESGDVRPPTGATTLPLP